MKCPNCGETSRIRQHDKFCHKCGCDLKHAGGTSANESVHISISRIDSRSFFWINNETIEIADYNIKSSADGSTELSVVIKGKSSIFETSAKLEVPMNISPLQRTREAFEASLHQSQELPLIEIKVPKLFEQPCIQTDE